MIGESPRNFPLPWAFAPVSSVHTESATTKPPTLTRIHSTPPPHRELIPTAEHLSLVPPPIHSTDWWSAVDQAGLPRQVYPAAYFRTQQLAEVHTPAA